MASAPAAAAAASAGAPAAAAASAAPAAAAASSSAAAAAADGTNTALVPAPAAASSSSAAARSGAGAAEGKQKKRKEKEAKLLPAMPSADDLQNALAIAREMAAEALSGPGEANAVDLKVHPSGIVPTLQNIVATVSLGLKLNLKDIAMRARNAEYNPKRFSAVIMRIREPKTTALVFTTGKMVVTGAKSEQQARLAARKYARIIQKLGFPEVKFLGFKIENLVGSCDVKFPIRLEGLAHAHDEFSSYEPELFPGLIYRMVAPKIVLLIFVSGKVVLTGAKSREQIYEAFENIYPVLTEFRKEAHDDGAAGVHD